MARHYRYFSSGCRLCGGVGVAVRKEVTKLQFASLDALQRERAWMTKLGWKPRGIVRTCGKLYYQFLERESVLTIRKSCDAEGVPRTLHYWMAYIDGAPAGCATGAINDAGEYFVCGVEADFDIACDLIRSQLAWAKRRGANVAYAWGDDADVLTACGFSHFAPDWGLNNIQYWRMQDL